MFLDKYMNFVGKVDGILSDNSSAANLTRKTIAEAFEKDDDSKQREMIHCGGKLIMSSLVKKISFPKFFSYFFFIIYKTIISDHVLALSETKALRDNPLAKNCVGHLNMVMGTRSGSHNLSLLWNEKHESRFHFKYPKGIR